MVDLKGVFKVTAKGKTYYYAWRGPKAPRLRSPPGTAAFVEELANAHAERKGGDPTTLSGLCARFRASDDWKGFAETTRRNWSPWLDRIQVRFGDLRLAQFDRAAMRPEIRKWRDQFKATPRAADVGLQVFSRLLAFALAEGRLASNIVTPIPHLYRNDRSGIIWTEDDLTALASVAPLEIMWAARLAAYTGLRQADVLRLSWTHVSPLAIEVRTRKTGSTVTIPVYAALKAFLATVPKRATTILTNTRKQPWGSGFGSSWQDAVKAAGIDKHFHDLRGTAATNFYRAGLSIREISAIMGWKEDNVEAIINVYVKRDELLKDRIRRMDEAGARTDAVKPTAKPGRAASPNNRG